MTQIKKYSLLVFLLLAGVLFSLVRLFHESSEPVEVKNVANSNLARKRSGIPIIEKDWINEKIGPGRIRWDDGVRGIESSDPVHLYKEILYDSGRIQLEKDAFHFEFSDSIQFRLILYHQYMQNDDLPERTRSELIIYEPRKFPPSHSTVLSRDGVDSVLQAWKIKI